MIKLVASDLDGTLLHNYQQTVPKEIYDTIKALHEKGIIFTAASGRQYANIRRLFAPLGFDISPHSYPVSKFICYFFCQTPINLPSICPSADLPGYFCKKNSCCCILPYMLPKRQCRYHDQYRHQDRKSFIPVGNLPVLPDRNTAEPACHAVNGRKQVDWLINCIQKPYCLRPDIRPCQNRPRIRGRIKNKAQHTYQPRIKIRSKKLVFHLLLPHRCHEIVHYPEKITPKINNNKLWHKRNHFIRRTRKIMSLDSRP